MKFYTRSFPASLYDDCKTLDETLNNSWAQANWLMYSPHHVTGYPLKSWDEALRFNDHDEAINGGPPSLLMLQEFSITCQTLDALIFKKQQIPATKVRWYEKNEEAGDWKLIEQRILRPENIAI